MAAGATETAGVAKACSLGGAEMMVGSTALSGSFESMPGADAATTGAMRKVSTGSPFSSFEETIALVVSVAISGPPVAEAIVLGAVGTKDSSVTGPCMSPVDASDAGEAAGAVATVVTGNGAGVFSTFRGRWAV